MKGWVFFLYGVAAGIAIAWGFAVFVYDDVTPARWYSLGSGVTLAAALTLHQRRIAQAKGRRWRRTRH